MDKKIWQRAKTAINAPGVPRSFRHNQDKQNIASILLRREIGGSRKQVRGYGEDRSENYWAEAESAEKHESRYFQLPLSTKSTISIAISPDGRTFASTHGDHTVKIVCYETGRILQTLVGHPRTPWSVKFHPTDSRYIASGCLGHQVRFWDIETGKCLYISTLRHSIISISFHPRGDVLAIASGTCVYTWNYQHTCPRIAMFSYQTLRSVSFLPDPTKIMVGEANERPPREDRPQNTKTDLTVTLTMWDFNVNWALRLELVDRMKAMTNPRVVLSHALIYNDGGFDISRCGRYLAVCADFSLRQAEEEGLLDATQEDEILSTTQDPLGVDTNVANALTDPLELVTPSYPISTQERNVAMIGNQQFILPVGTNSTETQAQIAEQYRWMHHIHASTQQRMNQLNQDRNQLFPSTPTSQIQLPASLSGNNRYPSPPPIRRIIYGAQRRSTNRRLRPPTMQHLRESQPRIPITQTHQVMRRMRLSPTMSLQASQERFYAQQNRNAVTNQTASSISTHNPSISLAVSRERRIAQRHGAYAAYRQINNVRNDVHMHRPLMNHVHERISSVERFNENHPNIAFSMTQLTETQRINREYITQKVQSTWLALISLDPDPNNLGRVIQTSHLEQTAVGGVTSVRISPTSAFVLLGYGVRDRMQRDIEFPEHRVTRIYRWEDMKLFSHVESEFDDVNIALFSPISGAGFLYGTKQGKLRVCSTYRGLYTDDANCNVLNREHRRHHDPTADEFEDDDSEGDLDDDEEDEDDDMDDDMDDDDEEDERQSDQLSESRNWVRSAHARAIERQRRRNNSGAWSL